MLVGRLVHGPSIHVKKREKDGKSAADAVHMETASATDPFFTFHSFSPFSLFASDCAIWKWRNDSAHTDTVCLSLLFLASNARRLQSQHHQGYSLSLLRARTDG